MANVGRISGPLLKANLVRNGINLAVEDDLLLIDVNNSRIGVNTLAPAHSLDVTGTTQTTALLSGQATVDNVDIDGNDITVLADNLRLTGFSATDAVEVNDLLLTQNEITTVTNGDNILINTNNNSSVVVNNRLTINNLANADTKMSYGSVSFNGETTEALIETTTTDLDLELSSNGLGKVITNSNTQVGSDADPKNFRVTGDTILNGNLRVDGNITIGDADTDSITIGADFESSLIPNAPDTYDLGTATKIWRDAYVGDLQLTTNSLTATVTNSDVRLTPNGTGNVVADTTKAIVVPVGSSAQRPADTIGALRWNTTNENFEAFDNRTGIQDWAVIPLGQNVRRFYFTATASQTSFSGTDDRGEVFSTVPGGTELVTVDGILLEEDEEYTTTDTNLSLLTGAPAGANVNVISLGTFKVADVVPKSTGGVFEGNVRILENFSVVGTTKLTDRIVSVGTGPGGNVPTSDDSMDRGVNFMWHNGSSAKNGFFGFDDSTGYFTFVPDATITNKVVSGALGDIQASSFRGDLIASTITSDTLTLTSALPVTSGGTGLASTVQGDVLFGNGANSLGALSIGVADTVLTSDGTAPTWSTSLSLDGTLTIGGVFNQTDATQSTSATTGAIVTAGGLGVAKDLHVAGSTFIVGDLVVDGDANINSSALTTTSKTIVLAEGSADAVAANNSGVVIDLGTDGTANILYASASDRIVFDKAVESTTFVGSLTGNADTASKWTTSRTISLTGAVTGSVTGVDGSSNVSIATTATADPKLTLSGDASGTATFTNLGDATLAVTVNNATTADAWSTSRTVSLTGAVTGSVTGVDGSGNVSIATTATSDPTLTLDGDATGSATFTDLGDATLTVSVTDDSHNHTTLSEVSSVAFSDSSISTAIASTSTATTTSVTATPVATFDTTTYGSAKFLVQATQGTDRHIAEVLLVTDGTTSTLSSVSEVFTGASLFAISADVDTGNARLLVESTSATSTTYVVSYTLLAS